MFSPSGSIVSLGLFFHLLHRVPHVVLLLGGLSGFGFSAEAEWQNSLKPAGTPARLPLPLVQDGKPAAGILCTENATANDKVAATELQKWIKEITGATLPIYFGGAPGRNIIIRSDSRLGEDGYWLRAKDAHVLLWGGTKRGLMNGVFALLEEEIGCRFYTKDSIRLPTTNTLVIAPVERRYIPQLKLRDPYYSSASDPAWSLRNRTSAPHAKVPEEQGGHVDYDGMFVHTAAQIVPVAKYFSTNPEYFSQLKDGKRSADQLCATHPDVAKLAIAFVRSVLSQNTNTELVSVSKNDNTTECHCERCEKLRIEEGSDMANQLVLVNQVAEAIANEYPRATIDTLAYLETVKVPKTVRPRKNVAIRLCNAAAGSWDHPFTPAEQCDIAGHIAAWAAAHDRIYVWDYTVNFSHYLAPMPNLDVMAANIRFWAGNHAEGVMLQGGYQGPAERDELKSWVAGKLLWDPSRDVKALTLDFTWGHYAAAAPALAEYESLLSQIRVDFADQMNSPGGGIRYPMEAPFFTKEFVARATEIFSRAKRLSRNDASLLRRVERAELPILYLQCVRGPKFTGTNYAQVVAAFERIARREEVLCLKEGNSDFETRLAEFKKQIRGTASK